MNFSAERLNTIVDHSLTAASLISRACYGLWMAKIRVTLRKEGGSASGCVVERCISPKRLSDPCSWHVNLEPLTGLVLSL